MLRLDTRLAAAEPGIGATLLEFFQDVFHGPAARGPAGMG
jgi:hypothetical protein